MAPCEGSAGVTPETLHIVLSSTVDDDIAESLMPSESSCVRWCGAIGYVVCVLNAITYVGMGTVTINMDDVLEEGTKLGTLCRDDTSKACQAFAVAYVRTSNASFTTPPWL